MSQSDYIKYKKTSTVLKELKKFEPVLSNENYIHFKQYNAVNNIINTETLLNELKPNNMNIVFNMQIKTTNCPSYSQCNALITNRIPMKDIYFTPKPMKKYVKQQAYYKTACNCMLNSVHTSENKCKCKLSH